MEFELHEYETISFESHKHHKMRMKPVCSVLLRLKQDI